MGLKKTLSTLQLWGIAVGLVISGEYFGWNYGWGTAGTFGFAVVTAFIAVMYTTFVFSFTELTTSIPNAGGPFSYARRAFGPTGGYFAGIATLVEFVFAPPAVALAIGAYFKVQFPAVDAKNIAMIAFLVFMALNIFGVSAAANFELFVTVLAVIELMVFMGVVAPGFSWANFARGGWSGSDVMANHFTSAAIPGMFASIPTAIWFFLGIEGLAMAAEEVRNPRRSIPIAYVGGILTLVLLAFGVMVLAGGAGDWRALSNLNDPLPQAMKFIVGNSSGWLHMLVWLGLFGLVASFHANIIGYSRQVYALGRESYIPKWLAGVHPRFRTPHRAIIAGGIVGIAAIYSDDLECLRIAGHSLTENLITLSVFGAILLYLMSLLALFKLRRTEPDMVRTYKAPFYPYSPLIALAGVLVSLVSMVYYNLVVAGLFAVILILGYAYFQMTHANRTMASVAQTPEKGSDPL
ncbi:MAG TPA: ethanolamine permease [Opitutaceae bacterium]|nr:ethanolamine permease [Opitutaceae bacterium]